MQKRHSSISLMMVVKNLVSGDEEVTQTTPCCDQHQSGVLQHLLKGKSILSAMHSYCKPMTELIIKFSFSSALEPNAALNRLTAAVMNNTSYENNIDDNIIYCSHVWQDIMFLVLYSVKDPPDGRLRAGEAASHLSTLKCMTYQKTQSHWT